MVNIDKRTKEIGIEIPELVKPKYLYVPAKISGKLIYVSGQLPYKNGELLYKGKLDESITLEEGFKAAELATLNCISAMKFVVGDLNKVKEIIKLNGFVSSSNGFDKQALVIDKASNLLIELWGESGKHARKAIGVSELPGGSVLEIELIASLF